MARNLLNITRNHYKRLFHPPVLLSPLAAETGSWAGGSDRRLDHMKVGFLPSRAQVELRCRGGSGGHGPHPG